MTTSPYKLRLNIGGSEFEAEGDKDAVMEQYRMFLEALRAPVASAKASPSPVAQTPADAASTEGYAEPEPSPAPAPRDPTTISAEIMDRVFSRERGVISLRILPHGNNRDADTLLLLLYGYKKIKGELDVYATQLMKAATQSGLNIDRVDRVIVAHKGLYVRGGARRGVRYGLNNQGEVRATSILADLLA